MIVVQSAVYLIALTPSFRFTTIWVTPTLRSRMCTAQCSQRKQQTAVQVGWHLPCCHPVHGNRPSHVGPPMSWADFLLPQLIRLPQAGPVEWAESRWRAPATTLRGCRAWCCPWAASRPWCQVIFSGVLHWAAHVVPCAIKLIGCSIALLPCPSSC